MSSLRVKAYPAGKDARVGIGLQYRLNHMIARHSFQPDVLPDAALRGIPDVSAIDALLAAQLTAELAWIGNAYEQLERLQCIVRIRQTVGDVERKRCVSARVGAEQPPVAPDGAHRIDRLEMQQYAIG